MRTLLLALMVALLPVTAQAQFVAGTPVTLQNVGDTAGVNGTNMGSYGVTFGAGSFVGQVVAECSMDLLSYAPTLFNVQNTSVVPIYTISAPTAVQLVSVIPVEGCRYYRVRVVNVSTGTVQATIFGTLTVSPTSDNYIAPPNSSALPPANVVVGGTDGMNVRTLATTPGGVLYVKPVPSLPLPSCNALVKKECR